MNRKEAVQYIGLLLGGALVGANSFLTGCRGADQGQQFSTGDIALLDEIADTILPPTATPGAKDAKVGAFMAIMVNECYDKNEQETFVLGMKKLRALCQQKYNASFTEMSPADRHELLVQLDREQKEYMRERKEEQPAHYFRMMKELTLLGYFTSEPGCTKAKRYVPVPGRFEGCIPYKKGDKAFV